jgi:Kef-type K+ transport system membrane component KefB
VLFFTLQSTTTVRLSTSILVLGGMIVLLPGLFRLFARRFASSAPNTEFAFLLMVAVLCALVTRRLGVYYLVGAFIVGVIAQRFRERVPAMASDRTLYAVEIFATVFVPFYFFSAGLHLHRDDFAPAALLVGGAFLVIMVPLRIFMVALHRRLAIGEPIRRGIRIGVSMVPTLVFTLVLAEIGRDTFGLPLSLFGGLIIYTLVNTLIPGFALRLPAPEMDVWHATENPPGGGLPAPPPEPRQRDLDPVP